MILLGLLSHFISDFILQSQRLVNDKKERILIGNLIHFLIVFLTSVLVFSISLLLLDEIPSFSMVIVLLGYSCMHLVIDLTKSLILTYKNMMQNGIYLYFLLISSYMSLSLYFILDYLIS